MIAEGRKARPRKAPIIRPKELTLHMSVADVLRRYAKPEWRWTHIPSGELRDVRVARKLKQMGLKRGWPDFALISPRGLFHALELKRIGETLTDDQDEFHMWCVSHGVPHVVAFTMRDVLVALHTWNCLSINISEGSL